MSETDSYEFDNYNSINVLEEYKKDDAINFEKLLKILEIFGFSEIAIK
jgi:hypothetical protein